MSGTATNQLEKALQALKRAVPLTRMIDYGMARGDAQALATLDVGSGQWTDVARALADHQEAKAETSLAQDDRTLASQHFAWAGAALIVGQLALNHDVALKVAMYRSACALYERSAELDTLGQHRILLTADGIDLSGWCFPHVAAQGAVVILGGLSGWGAAYWSMAKAMQARGLAVILAEAPGQGETRMNGGTYLSHESLDLICAFVTEAARHSPRVGMMGNSFGALVAAHVAAQNSSIAALCLNGAVPNMTVPEFRTAREQMEAAFGVEGEELERRVGRIAFDPRVSTIQCPTLIVEGGNDPLVPLGAQLGFLAETDRSRATVLTWPDGEHTIYNHDVDRNALVSAWFIDRLSWGQ